MIMYEKDIQFVQEFLDTRSYVMATGTGTGNSTCYNSLHASREFVVLANSLNPDQDQQNVGFYLDLNCFTLR